jgi:hypothetical protein
VAANLAVESSKRPEDLLIGALATLALRGIDNLRTTDKSFHEYFAKALSVFRDAGGEVKDLADRYYCNIASKTYDELDHALIAAEQYGLVKFPNPSYSRVQITMSPRIARKLLEDWKDEQEVFEQAANALYESTYA